MKKIVAFSACCLLFTALQAQINVRVKNSGNTKEIDIKTGGRPAAGKSDEAKQTQGSTKTSTQPAIKDTVPKTPADESYNGPAKVQLKAFWRQMDKLRAGDATPSTLSNAERMLKQVKENDPSYNVSALETEVASYREKADAGAKAKTAAAGKADAEKNYYRDVWQKMINVYSKGSILDGGTGKDYLDKVQAINLAEYNERKKTANEAEVGNFVKLIDEMLADYDNYLIRTDRLRWNVTEVLVKARNEPNPQEKLEMLRQAKYECEGVLVMSPNNAAFKQKLNDVNKLLGNADAEASKNYTGDFHKQNVGKIVWSNKPLLVGKENDMAANIKTGFKTGEAIFGTIYLGNKASQLMNGNDRIRVIIRIDNGTAVWGGDLSNIIIPLPVQDKPYIQFALLPDDAWFSSNYAPYIDRENWTYSYLIDQLATTGDISHEITCEFDFPTNIQSNIKGALTLDLNDGSDAIKTLSTKLHNQLMASRTLPKAGMSNTGLEQQMLAAANNLGWNDKFLKTIITSSSWVIVKNELTGAILYRYLGAVCTTKSNDGKCYYQEFSFKQDYTGGGNYNSIVKYNSYGGKREIGCDKIK